MQAVFGRPWAGERVWWWSPGGPGLELVHQTGEAQLLHPLNSPTPPKIDRLLQSQRCGPPPFPLSLSGISTPFHSSTPPYTPKLMLSPLAIADPHLYLLQLPNLQFPRPVRFWTRPATPKLMPDAKLAFSPLAISDPHLHLLHLPNLKFPNPSFLLFLPAWLWGSSEITSEEGR